MTSNVFICHSQFIDANLLAQMTNAISYSWFGEQLLSSKNTPASGTFDLWMYLCDLFVALVLWSLEGCSFLSAQAVSDAAYTSWPSLVLACSGGSQLFHVSSLWTNHRFQAFWNLRGECCWVTGHQRGLLWVQLASLDPLQLLWSLKHFFFNFNFLMKE